MLTCFGQRPCPTGWFRSCWLSAFSASVAQALGNAGVRIMQVRSVLHQTQWVNVSTGIGRPSHCCRQRIHLQYLQRAATHSLHGRDRRSCTTTAKAADGARTDAQQLLQSLPDSREQAVRFTQHLCAVWCLAPEHGCNVCRSGKHQRR